MRARGKLRRNASLCAGLLCACAALTMGIPSAAQEALPKPVAGSTRVMELRIDDIIQPVLAEYLGNAFDEAAKQGMQLILITMNTPGGLDSAMRDIIQRIITSPIPVVVYVNPPGSRAASAGFYILLSADVAAMAPGTDTGAASPIFMIGGQTIQVDETLKKKAFNESAAYLRSISGKRGRNVELAEKAVTEAKAFTDKEALDGKLIDIVASSTEELLQKLEGREITRFDGTKLKISLPNPVRSGYEMNWRLRFLSRLARPDVLFILIIVALLGLYMEFSHPGLIVPGIVGGLALLMVLIAVQILPVNVMGVLLILAAVVLFILEAKYTSHGVLGLAGAAAMIAGALLLIKSPLTGWGVSPMTAIILTLPFAGIAIFLMRRVIQSFGWKPSTGTEKLVGAVGEVTVAVVTPHADGTVRGMAFVSGELWRVAARVPVAQGGGVRVLKVDGLTLHVEPLNPPQVPSQG